MVSQFSLGKFSFVRHPGQPIDGCSDPLIEFTLPGDTGVDELIQAFHRFMLACGYSADVEIEVVYRDEKDENVGHEL